jgi:drug/metabolite transporter (DMT)-like permease
VNVPVYVAALVILAGNAVLSLGNSLQKLNIGWMKKTASLDAIAAPKTDRSRAVLFMGWFIGFLMMNSVPVFQFIALLGLPANVVAAFAGSSVAFTAIFARFLLGERIGLRRTLWTLVLFAAIAGAGLLGKSFADEAGFSPTALFIFIGLPLLATLGLLIFRCKGDCNGDRAQRDKGDKGAQQGDRANGAERTERDRAQNKHLAPFFAGISGCFGGYMVITMRALQIDAGANISIEWFSSPYLYAFILCGFGGFSIVQLAYKDGEMARVAPALYGMQVLWPAIASYFVFGSPFVILQATAFLIVAISVVAIAGNRDSTMTK